MQKCKIFNVTLRILKIANLTERLQPSGQVPDLPDSSPTTYPVGPLVATTASLGRW